MSQVLGFLRLDPEVLKTLTALGDPLPSPIVTERMLRAIINLPAEEQRQRLEAILMDNDCLDGRPLDRTVQGMV